MHRIQKIVMEYFPENNWRQVAKTKWTNPKKRKSQGQKYKRKSTKGEIIIIKIEEAHNAS